MWFILLIAVLFAVPAWGQPLRTWIPTLTEQTSPSAADSLLIITDTSTTPVNKKITWSTLASLLGSITSQTATCTDSGDGNHGTLTLVPTAGYSVVNVSLTVADSDGCAVTMSETGATAGKLVFINNISAYHADFATSSGVLVLTQGDFAIAQNESLVLQYNNSQWVEIARSSATINIATINLPSSNSDPATTAGQVKHDSSDTDVSSGGSWKGYNGANVDHFVKAGTDYTYIVKTAYLPVAYMEDGTAAPGSATVTADTRKVRTRDFAADADDDVEIHWLVPDDYVGGIKFRPIGFVTNATAPANTETVIFNLAGCSVGASDDMGCTLGTGVTSTFTADATYAQYDRWAGAWSAEITVTNILAGESAMLKLFRDVDDTYGQAIGLAGIEIKYKAKIMLNSTY